MKCGDELLRGLRTPFVGSRERRADGAGCHWAIGAGGLRGGARTVFLRGGVVAEHRGDKNSRGKSDDDADGKDEGVFAISYKLEGPFDDLKSDVNMMSAVTPGVLRDLFKGTSGGAASSQQPAQQP